MTLWMSLLIGCGTPAVDTTPDDTQIEETEVETDVDPETPDVSVIPGDDVDLYPDEAPPSRVARRIDIDQLRASIFVATGLKWEVNNTDQFTALSLTLGKPDFVKSTTENLSPSVLYEKFLDDAAVSVCDRLITAEKTRAQTDRIFLKYADTADRVDTDRERIAENMRYLVLRFHGRVLVPGVEADDQALERWLWLHESTEHVTDGNGSAAWRAVCVGLIVHPDFSTY